MGVVIIFLPCHLYNADSGYLLGLVQTLVNGSTVFFVLGYTKKASQLESNSKFKLIGVFYPNGNSEPCIKTSREKHWLDVRLRSDQFLISSITVNRNDVLNESTTVISIIIDPQMFETSELLKGVDYPCIGGAQSEDVDHFEVLTTLLRDLKQETSKDSISGAFHHVLFLRFLTFILKCSNLALQFLRWPKLFFVIRISWICCHFINFLENMVWCLSTYIAKKKLTLKAGNYLLGRILDSIFGILTLYFLMENFSNKELFQLMANIPEDIVMKLRIVIPWLMGSPAGLKLHAPLTYVLGHFFLYHVNLWWSFLITIRPGLEFMYACFLRISLLGLSFQIAILSDLLMITSFHIYCIYVYAAKLYSFQLKWLFDLFRLVIGRKRNPLPGQVDSHPYTTEQLFLGTLAFTILLFLLPTTFVYYLMFAMLRAVLVAIGGLLARFNFLLQTLPVFVILQWIFNHPRTTNSIYLTPKTIHSRPNHLVLYVTPVTISLWSIIKSTIPDTVNFPAEVDWPNIIQSLFSGQLLYTI